MSARVLPELRFVVQRIFRFTLQKIEAQSLGLDNSIFNEAESLYAPGSATWVSEIISTWYSPPKFRQILWNPSFGGTNGLNLLRSILTILLTCPNSNTLLCYSNDPFLAVRLLMLMACFNQDHAWKVKCFLYHRLRGTRFHCTSSLRGVAKLQTDRQFWVN